jgi:site-specific DNA-methyltransferase (adenine-specific)
VKPYFQDEWTTIYCGDCREILPELPKVDLVVTSPPYDKLREYDGMNWDFKTVSDELSQCLLEGGVLVWVVGDSYLNGSETCSSFKQALRFKEIGLNLHDTMIYAKDNFSSPMSNRYYQLFEYMFVFSKGSPKTFNPLIVKSRGYPVSKSGTKREPNGHTELLKYAQGADYRKDGNIWFYSVGYMKSSKDSYVFEHPAIFPEGLALDHISSWSNPNDLILDPFLGSGTTCYCAKKLGRHSIGIEISEKYCQIAVERLRQGVMDLSNAQ